MDGWIVSFIFAGIIVFLFVNYRKSRTEMVGLRIKHDRLRQDFAQLQTQTAKTEAFSKSQAALNTDAIIYLDNEQHIISANGQANAIFGRIPPGGTLIGWTKYHYLSEMVAQAASVPGHISQQFNHKGRIFEARVMAVQAYSNPVGTVLMLRDVSELQRLGRARRDLVANISHDLRTPISGIRLVAETLDSGAIQNLSVAKDLVQKILIETETLEQVNQELMDLSMIESGRLPLKLVPIDLGKLVKKEVKRLKHQAERKKIELNVDIPPGVSVLADKGLLSRVLSNLLHNAIKFTDEGSVSIGVATSQEADMACVTVADTGCGIEDEYLLRVFERFFKSDGARTADNTETRAESGKKAGTGLGLAIARHIVESHGGSIWAKSKLGQGATFYFTIPAE